VSTIVRHMMHLRSKSPHIHTIHLLCDQDRRQHCNATSVCGKSHYAITRAISVCSPATKLCHQEKTRCCTTSTPSASNLSMVSGSWLLL
jgi:hypothetical protein